MNFTWNTKTKFKIFSSASASMVQSKIAAQNILYLNTNKFVDEHLKNEIKKEVDEFNKKDLSLVPDVELREFTADLSDYYGLSHDTTEAVSHYMVVASYSAYEKGLKQILKLSGKLNDAELRSCFRIVNVIQLLSSKFGIAYSSLADHDKIEEIRCLNNDIKHNGIVGIELPSINNKWVQGGIITNTYVDFERLCDGPYNLLNDLSNKIEASL